MPDDAIVEFRLYVAGALPNSRRAVVNLETFCREHLPDRHRIEILDVFEDPQRALAEGILLTPQLVVVRSRRTLKLIGDLADVTELARAFETGTDRS